MVATQESGDLRISVCGYPWTVPWLSTWWWPEGQNMWRNRIYKKRVLSDGATY